MTLTPQYVKATEAYNIVRRLGRRIMYADGSYNQGVSGWAVVENNELIYQNWSRGLTSNLAEGMAILEAFRIMDPTEFGIIVTDSRTWAECINGRKTMKGKETKEILQEIYSFFPTNIHIVWTKGHSGEVGNELADMYAKQARSDKVSKTILPEKVFTFVSR